MQAQNTYTSHFYRKFAEPSAPSGTLAHEALSGSASVDSGGPVHPGAESGTGTPEHRPAAALFVSTNLQLWITEEPHAFARDVQINDTAHRRLDPEYYAWLRSRMNLAKSAHQAGEIDGEAYESLRVAFNAVHDWAIEHFGAPALLDAARSLDARDYRVPAAEPDTPVPAGTASAARSRLLDAVALVDAIAQGAFEMGWKRERLYGTGPLFSPNRGLVRYLKPGDRLGNVTLQAIEIIGPPPTEVRQHFYNPDVDQPWILRVR